MYDRILCTSNNLSFLYLLPFYFDNCFIGYCGYQINSWSIKLLFRYRYKKGRYDIGVDIDIDLKLGIDLTIFLDLGVHN